MTLYRSGPCTLFLMTLYFILEYHVPLLFDDLVPFLLTLCLIDKVETAKSSMFNNEFSLLY